MKSLRKTWKNKIIAVGIVILSIMPLIVFEDEHDITFTIICLFIALPLFFAKENAIRF